MAATNRDPEQAVKEGRLREDLFYRLNVFHLNVPPLRERREDIAPLAARFIAAYSEQNQKTVEGVTNEAMAALERYDWPGNVRELRNAIERAVVLSRDRRFTDLPQRGASVVGPSTRPLRPRVEPLEEIERRAILEALRGVREQQDPPPAHSAQPQDPCTTSLRYAKRSCRERPRPVEGSAAGAVAGLAARLTRLTAITRPVRSGSARPRWWAPGCGLARRARGSLAITMRATVTAARACARAPAGGAVAGRADPEPAVSPVLEVLVARPGAGGPVRGALAGDPIALRHRVRPRGLCHTTASPERRGRHQPPRPAIAELMQGDAVTQALRLGPLRTFNEVVELFRRRPFGEVRSSRPRSSASLWLTVRAGLWSRAWRWRSRSWWRWGSPSSSAAHAHGGVGLQRLREGELPAAVEGGDELALLATHQRAGRAPAGDSPRGGRRSRPGELLQATGRMAAWAGVAWAWRTRWPSRSTPRPTRAPQESGPTRGPRPRHHSAPQTSSRPTGREGLPRFACAGRDAGRVVDPPLASEVVAPARTDARSEDRAGAGRDELPDRFWATATRCARRSPTRSPTPSRRYGRRPRGHLAPAAARRGRP
jgi:hypothetical protein